MIFFININIAEFTETEGSPYKSYNFCKMLFR